MPHLNETIGHVKDPKNEDSQMKYSRGLAIFLIFMALGLPGCGSRHFIDPRVAIIDDQLLPGLTITDVKATPHYGGFMEVQVTGKNRTSVYKKLEYRIDWLDHNEMIIPSVMSGWKQFPCFENAEFRFKAIAPTTTATDFRIIIRKEKPKR